MNIRRIRETAEFLCDSLDSQTDVGERTRFVSPSQLLREVTMWLTTVFLGRYTLVWRGGAFLFRRNAKDTSVTCKDT